MSGDDPYVVQLAGRLGNQLFGYAFGTALARRSGAPVVYLVPFRDPAQYVLPALLRTPPSLASPTDRRRVGLVEGVTLPARIRRGLQRVHVAGRSVVRPLRLVQEHDPYEFDAGLFDAEAPCLVRGYFQDVAYADAVTDELMAALLLPTIDLPDHVLDRPGGTVAVHFRRGDYVGAGLTLAIDYYERALALVERRCAIGSLILIGDDPDFVRLAAHYFGDRYACVVDANEVGSGPIHHLALLSTCDHCVISNSTFAWWGAWIGDQRQPSPDRLVVAPDPWLDVGTPVPARWTTVEA